MSIRPWGQGAVRRAGIAVGCALALAATLAGAPASAQMQKLNPQISVIGDTRGVWTEDTDETELEFHELEIALVGPVNPYASAEVYVGVHGTEGLEVEEAKLILDRYLPGGLGITVGRYLQDFGQLNQVHLHAYPWVERALMHQEFFGEDGVVDAGARLDWIAPVDAVTLRASAGAVRGDLFVGGHTHGGEAAAAEEEEEAGPEIGFTGRLDLFAEPSEDVSLLLGASVMHGVHDTAEDAKVLWFEGDAKVRFDLGPYRALVVNAETIFGSLEESDEAPASDPTGFFAAADLRANQRWNVGGFAESTAERADDSIRTNRYGGFLGLSLMEETTLFRVVAAVTDPDEGDSSTGVTVQALFGLGPHRPHRY
ncbi:hypothetical protein K8I85_13890 [bacterium]|nr:hypothetical protein [bacterium]